MCRNPLRERCGFGWISLTIWPWFQVNVEYCFASVALTQKLFVRHRSLELLVGTSIPRTRHFVLEQILEFVNPGMAMFFTLVRGIGKGDLCVLHPL